MKNIADAHAVEYVRDLGRAYVLSRALHVAAEMGIADHIGAAPVDVAEVASRIQANAAALTRLLRLLASAKIFSEVAPGRFVSTAYSDVLRDDHPRSIRSSLRIVNPAWWAAVGQLSYSVATGQPAFDRLHGTSLFSYLKADSESQTRFDAGMANNSRDSDEAIARAYDFSVWSSVLDIGGGRGGLLNAILARHPRIEVSLFEQPQVVEHAVIPTGARFSPVGGDFLCTVPNGHDLHILKGVLHDFCDEQCLTILRNSRRALPDHGRLLIIERVVQADNRPAQAKTIDILMLALLGGRERGAADWSLLLEKCGFRLQGQLSTASEFTIFEAQPRSSSAGAGY